MFTPRLIPSSSADPDPLTLSKALGPSANAISTSEGHSAPLWTAMLNALYLQPHISRTGGDAMKLIIEARMECTDSDLRREPAWRSCKARDSGPASAIGRKASDDTRLAH